MESELKHYQLSVFLSPLLDEKQLQELIAKIKNWILENSGQVNDEKISKKRLAYKIKHFQDAFYLLLSFSIAPDQLSKITDKLKLQSDILRHLVANAVVIKPAKQKQPKKVTTSKKPSRQDYLIDKFIDKESTYGLKADKPEPKAEKPKDQAPNAPAKKEKLDLADLDKKLDEILND